MQPILMRIGIVTSKELMKERLTTNFLRIVIVIGRNVTASTIGGDRLRPPTCKVRRRLPFVNRRTALGGCDSCVLGELL